MRHPINDRKLLEKRQKALINYDIDIEILKDYESDILWIYKIAEEINENNSIEILFPSSFILSYINYIETLLDMYHLYKIYYKYYYTYAFFVIFITFPPFLIPLIDG